MGRGLAWLIGNVLVVLVIVVNKKMRHSTTNLFIANLAVADLIIMLFGVPEITQFIINRGFLANLQLISTLGRFSSHSRTL